MVQGWKVGKELVSRSAMKSSGLGIPEIGQEWAVGAGKVAEKAQELEQMPV